MNERKKPTQIEKRAVPLPLGLLDMYVALIDKGDCNTAGEIIQRYIYYWLYGEEIPQNGLIGLVMQNFAYEADRIKAKAKAISDKARDSVNTRYGKQKSDTNVNESDTNVQKTLPTLHNITLHNITLPPHTPQGTEVGDLKSSIIKILSEKEDPKVVNFERVADDYAAFIESRIAAGTPIKNPPTYFVSYWYNDKERTKHLRPLPPEPPARKPTNEEKDKAFAEYCRQKKVNTDNPEAVDQFCKMMSSGNAMAYVVNLLSRTPTN